MYLEMHITLSGLLDYIGFSKCVTQIPTLKKGVALK